MTTITRRAALAATALAALTLSVPALAQAPQVVRIGVSPGPHAEILEKVKPLLAPLASKAASGMKFQKAGG